MSFAVRALWLAALTLLMLRAAAFAPRADTESGRQAFIAALQRVTQRQADQPDPPTLKAYAIYPYLIAARLRRDLAAHADEALDARIEAFLADHGMQPVTRSLRREWLHSLAQRARWDWFLPRATDLSDPQIACERLAGRVATGDTATLAVDALARWSLPQRQPTQCNVVFGWLRQQGLLSAELIEARARAALAADNPRLARDVAADLPAPAAAELLRWSDLLESPKGVLNSLSTHPAAAVEADALLAGFDRLSRTDIAASFALLPALLGREDMTPATAARLRRSAALGAAYARDPRSLEAFAQLPLEAVDTLVQEWRVRAALWSGDFVRVRAWIEQMPPELAGQPRWRYWRARATAAIEGEVAAAPLYAELADLRDLYGYLAADRLKRPYQLNAHPTPDDVGTQWALASEPGLLRAHELFECNLADDAATEWNLALNGAGNALKVQAVRLASRWGWYAQAIATLAQTGEFDDVQLRYPRPYGAIVQQGSQLAKVEEDWILAVMRQESLFRVDAVSRADARGIMQMQPATAAAVARRWHLKAPAHDDLFDPDVAILLGSAYLRELLDKYGANLELALAAYNAGPTSVERWLPGKSIAGDVWLENIPYNETRTYVQHTLEHIVAFAYVAGRTPPSVSALLPELGPPAAGL